MVRQMSVQELKTELDTTKKQPFILDVREPWECQICALPNSINIPMGQIPARLGELDPDQEIIVLCHHGIRSYQVCNFLQSNGFENLYNLKGGIDAWSKEIDPAMQKY